MKSNFSQHLWSQNFESVKERITLSPMVFQSNYRKHWLSSLPNLQPKQERAQAGPNGREASKKKTRVIWERYFKNYCFPQGLARVVAVQWGLVTAELMGLPVPLVHFDSKQGFLCKMGFHCFFPIFLVKILHKYKVGEMCSAIALVSLFWFQFHFSLVTKKTIFTDIC